MEPGQLVGPAKDGLDDNRYGGAWTQAVTSELEDKT